MKTVNNDSDICEDCLDVVANHPTPCISHPPTKRYYLVHKQHSTYVTQREADCLSYLLQGLTAKEIGKELGISYRTVEFYFEKIKKRLQCRTRLELMSIILQSDVIKCLMNGK